MEKVYFPANKLLGAVRTGRVTGKKIYGAGQPIKNIKNIILVTWPSEDAHRRHFLHARGLLPNVRNGVLPHAISRAHVAGDLACTQMDDSILSS